MILPPIDEHLADKFIVLKVEKHEMPMRTGSNSERKAFWNTLMEELPCYLHELLQTDIPAEYASERFGIKHFLHPEIMDTICKLAPEFKIPGRATSFSPLCLPWEFFCAAKATDDGERDTKFQVSPCTLAPLLTSCSKMILSMSPKNYIFHTDLPAIGIPNINPNIVTLPQAPTPFRDCAHLVASWTHPSQLVYEFAGT
jgi:hypothetical protein